jgi:hypothetical protein
MQTDNNFLPKGYFDSWSIIFTMSSLKGYVRLVEANMQIEADNMREAFKKKIVDIEKREDYTGEYQNHLIDKLSEEFRELDYNFKGWFRNSIIIQLYSFLEVNLFKICENHKREYEKEYSVKDLKGHNDLDKAIKYLKISAKINIKELPQWQFVDNMRKLRNCIVHAEGSIDNSANDFRSIYDFSKNHFEINPVHDLSTNYQVYLNDKEFISKCICEIESFLFQIPNNITTQQIEP